VTNAGLLEYYAARAAEYERVYEKPERQADLHMLHEAIPKLFDGRRVLEIACGTGYWTRRIAPRVASLTACDLTAEVLEIARAHPASRDVTFLFADAYDLSTVPGAFDAGFAGFWWSHVRLSDLNRFLAGFLGRLDVGARVVFLDNNYVDGSSYPISRTDDAGNTYQCRHLENGDEYEVLKNFPSERAVRGALEAAGAKDVEVVELQHYWYVVARRP
jgi:SAM-dependent methyltransferase